MRNMTGYQGSEFRVARLIIATMFAVVAGGVNACARTTHPAVPATIGAPPPYVVGSFIDDYGGHHTISAKEWKQGDDLYDIVQWNADARYLIAENNSSSPVSLGRWTRIDWLRLDGMPPYTWAFCFSAYEMKTAAAAESSMVAKADTPRNGCNGYPFTRMRALTTTGK